MLRRKQKKISLILIASMVASLFGFMGIPPGIVHAAAGDTVTVALKSVATGKYISAGTSGDSSLTANATNPWFGELFDVIEQSDGTFALKSRANNKYVTVGASSTTPLVASASTVTLQEKFEKIVNTDDGTVSFKSKSYGKFISSPNMTTTFTSNLSNLSAEGKFQVSYFDFTKPLKILEIKDLDKDATAIASDLSSSSMKIAANSAVQLETMSIKTFVALRDELDGKYDAIYFGKSLFNPTSETGSNHDTRLEENDITPLKATEITDKYITKGLPVVVYSDSTLKRGALYQGYLNGSTWTSKTGNLNNLFNPFKTSTKSNVIFVENADIASISAFITKTNLLEISNVRPQLNITSKPYDYTLSANRNQKYKAGDTLTYNFNVSNVRNLGQRNLVANLYLGIDSVLKFDASQLVQTVPVTSLTNNTISFKLPKGYSGLYYWRLELVDQTSTGKLKDAASGVFRYQDQPPTINVLQVIPNSQSANKTSSLLLEANLKQTYLLSDDYKININVIDFNTFNSTEYSTLNSKYDMLIFGFNDSYNATANISNTAAAAVKSFIATGQGVMFTHDTIFQSNQTWIDYFQTDTGQIGPKTNMGLGAPNTSTSTVKVNEGLLTEFPFFISEITPQVATTHDQYFRLDLNDPKVIPWYNINGSPRDVEDSWNHYYTYSKGNVTYSGTGHNFVDTKRNSSFPDWEQKLFVNTMYRAFIGSNHKPTLEIISPVAFSSTLKNYISANSDISVSFKPDDLDLNDKKITSSVTFKYKDINGTDKVVKVLPDTETNKGDTVTKTFPNPLASSGGDLTISVSTKDASGAMETKEVAVKVITSTSLTPERTISAEKIEVNNPVTVSYSIKPTAKTFNAATNVSDLTITGLHFKETFPANLDLVTLPTNLTNLTKTGTLTSGFTLEGDITNIPYRQVGNQFIADPTTFNIVVKPTKSGDYSLSSANLRYTDYTAADAQNVLFSNKVISAFIKLTFLTLDNQTIAKDDTSKLLPRALPADASFQKDSDYTWASDATSIVTVTASGEIKGISAGTAKVTATAKDGSGLIATSIVSVIQPGLNITGPTEVAVNSTIQLQAALVTVNENVTSVSWSSSDSSTAAFTINNDRTGVLRGVKKGAVTVTATVVTDKGRTYTKDYKVSVYIPLTSLSIQNATIRVGESISLTPSYQPSNADYTTFNWSTDRADLVTLNSSTIVGVAAGTAKVTVTSSDNSNLSSTATITIVSPSLAISGPTSVNIGEKITLEALFSTINETATSITWASPDQDKASFVTDGDYKRVLTGVKAGNVNVSVTIVTNKGNTYTKSYSITVTTVPITSVKLDNAKIRVGETAPISTVILPANASNKTLTWVSNHPEWATVDTNGNVRGIAPGEAVITATSTDGTSKSSSATVTVIQPVMLISGPTKLFVGGSPITLQAELSTVNETPVTFTWNVSDEDKLKAQFITDGDSRRILTGKQAGIVTGTVTIVTDKGIPYTSNFSVTVISLKLNDTTLDIGKEAQLSPIIAPVGAINSNFNWSSSNPSVVTVDNKGNIQAKSAGTATITIVSVDNPTLSATATVTVIQPGISIITPNGKIGLNGESTLLVGNKLEYLASFESSNQKATSIKWDILDPADAVDHRKTIDDYHYEFVGKEVGTVTGKVTITTDNLGTYTSSFLITVINPVQTVRIERVDGLSTSINVDDSINLTAIITRSNASHTGFQWLTIEESGIDGDAVLTPTDAQNITFTAKKKGTVKVKVLVGGQSDTKSFEIKQELTSLYLPDRPIRLMLGSNTNTYNAFAQLVVIPSKWKTVLKDQLAWEIKDTTIAKMSDTEPGVIIGVKKGTTSVKVKYKDSLEDSVQIIVDEPIYNNKY
ncbi:DUF5057 domain-containing protein [Paenibacillus sp. N3.4]|uniref:DUF5057 domain-containing protein n=1 Tax=Paenibacillus sp. N3.4 TaxID=2603222 RepID=UPI0011C77485|nr:DUF5057 domain-containing protein [Paenibacillus sp. N3.4]TXK85386.1 DUF5057 domain-containing protein [Paenibacillus sp. N3.4]